MKLKFISKMISGMLIATCMISSLTGMQTPTAKAAENKPVAGEEYDFAGYKWIAAEVHDNYTVLQSEGIVFGAWPGYKDYAGSEILSKPNLEIKADGDGERLYIKNIAGLNIANSPVMKKYDLIGDEQEYSTKSSKLTNLYQNIHDYEYEHANFGNGLYLLTFEQIGAVSNGKLLYEAADVLKNLNSTQKNYHKGLTKAANNFERLYLEDACGDMGMDEAFVKENIGYLKNGSLGASVFLGESNEEVDEYDPDGGLGYDYNKETKQWDFSYVQTVTSELGVIAPAFNVDNSKIEVVGNEIKMKALPSKGQTDVCIISDISNEELDPDQLQVTVPQKLLFATKGNTNELIGTYSADNKLKNDGVNKVQFTSAKLNTEDGWEFVSDATKESTDNKVDFTITAERGDKTTAATTMTAAEMVNKKDLSTDENYKLNSKNKTNGSNYTELTSSGHVSGFATDTSVETKIGDIAWKVKVTH